MTRILTEKRFVRQFRPRNVSFAKTTERFWFFFFLSCQRPDKVWHSLDSQREFFDALAMKLGITSLDGWYNVGAKEVHQHGGTIRSLRNSNNTRHVLFFKNNPFTFVLGGGLLYNVYRDNLRTALRALYPNHEWLEWKFNSVSRNYWTSIHNQRAFFLWLGKQLNITAMSGWYNVSNSVLAKHGGAVFFCIFLSRPAVV